MIGMAICLAVQGAVTSLAAVDYYYRRPGGVDRYLRPDGTSYYLRP